MDFRTQIWKSIICPNNLTVPQYCTSHSLKIWWRNSLVILFQFRTIITLILMGYSLFYFPFENCFVIPSLFNRKGTIPIQKICAISVFHTMKDHYSNFFNSKISLFLSVTLAFSKPHALDSGARAKRNKPEKTQKKPITSNFNTIKYNLDYRLTLFIKARKLKVSYDILRSHFISDG